MTGSGPAAPPPVNKRKSLLDWLARGPFAIAASALQGGMNYLIVLWLSFGQSLAATGEYRTLFSCYSLVALVMMQESNKVFIRASVSGDKEAGAALFVNKLAFGLVAIVLLLLVWLAGQMTGTPWVAGSILPVVAVGVFVFSFDFYIAELQAHRRFKTLFVAEAVKYGGALLVFVGLFRMTDSVPQALIGQLCYMGVCQIGYFFLFARKQVRFDQIPGHIRALLRSEPAVQARTYSFSNMFPASVEHVDKLLVGWVFGLEVLGVYTLAYSTGRFLYNILKPAMYVYYRKFVDAMPGWALLRKVSLFFSALGLAMTLAFNLAIELSPSARAFEQGRWVTSILFCGYGIGIVHAVYSQAFSLNKDSVAGHAFKAHMLATMASLVLLAVGLALPASIALILLALQYPVRDGLSVFLMDRYRRAAAA